MTSLHIPTTVGQGATPCVNCGLEIHFNSSSRRYSSNEWNSISCKGGSN
jgi:hypothetical protein